MNLRVSRPALIEAFKRQGKDINNATQQEMRSLVCAQCHEEYYFKKGTNYLTFPFDKGQTVEAIEQYYDEQGFTDYVHKLSKTPILKAQHPGWSMFLQPPTVSTEWPAPTAICLTRLRAASSTPITRS